MAQFGWLIDLDRCIGCDTCAVACKSENNTRPVSSPLLFKTRGGTPVQGNPVGVMADHVSYRWVVKRVSGAYPAPAVSFVTSACNHCADPACMKACPVSNPNDPTNEHNAIFKRAADGIVIINDTVCIGCKQCIAACPYGAPQFNRTTRKVEKCTLCVHRLYDSSGKRTALWPACVTSCVGNALRLVEEFNQADSGAGAPEGFADPRLTRPSIKFGRRP
ncbi:MAG: 4Fe-4S dicluster domain-containing protein [Gammaproteobacteria bacterium]|nr:4Fe-4S dicluster domain-containing protein [Gammaproteobacteria bacterium]